MRQGGRHRNQGRWLSASFTLLLACLAPAAAAAPATEPIRERWRRPLGSVQCLAISPDGERVAVVTWASEVLCWEGGRERWRRTLPGAEVVALGAGGRAIVYTPLDALRRDLLLIDARGHPEGRITVGGPITALSLSLDGLSLAVGTAAGSVEVFQLKSRRRTHRFTIPGACQQLSHDRQGSLVVTTSEPARLLLFRADGRPIWQITAPPGSEFRIGTPARTAETGSGGGTVLAAVVASGRDSVARSQPPVSEALGAGGQTASALKDKITSKDGLRWRAPKEDDLYLIGISPSGKLLWRQTLKGRHPCLQVMPASGDTVIGYERADRRKRSVRYHRALACYGPDGSLLWEQGGMVYDPLLVSASPAGETVLSLCKGNRFWLLSGKGQEIWSFTTQARVRMARSSASGSTVAVATSNGQLLLLTINPGPGDARRRGPKLAQQGAETGR